MRLLRDCFTFTFTFTSEAVRSGSLKLVGVYTQETKSCGMVESL
jgi:hypothetical protein